MPRHGCFLFLNFDLNPNLAPKPKLKAGGGRSLVQLQPMHAGADAILRLQCTPYAVARQCLKKVRIGELLRSLLVDP